MAREAARRWWLSPEEVLHYGIDEDPTRAADVLSVAAFHEVGRRGLARPEHDPLLDDKWRFARHFAALGAALPTTFGLLHPEVGTTTDGAPLRSVDDLLAWCDATGTEQLVIKPVAGWGTQGVVLVTGVDRAAGAIRTADGAEVGAAELAASLQGPGLRGRSGHVVQELCHPHPEVLAAGLGPHDVVRVVTTTLPGAPPELQHAVLYSATPAGRSWRDGALSVAVDLGSGRLGSGRTLPRHGREPVTHHPGSGQLLVGAVLPDWSQLTDLVAEAAALVPEVPVVCWEVLLGERGPRLIEGNLAFGLTILQVHSDGFRRDGTAERWAAAGAELPDGSRAWARRHGAALLARRAATRLGGRGRWGRSDGVAVVDP